MGVHSGGVGPDWTKSCTAERDFRTSRPPRGREKSYHTHIELWDRGGGERALISSWRHTIQLMSHLSDFRSDGSNTRLQGRKPFHIQSKDMIGGEAALLETNCPDLICRRRSLRFCVSCLYQHPTACSSTHISQCL
jgi:hypothetical protein